MRVKMKKRQGLCVRGGGREEKKLNLQKTFKELREEEPSLAFKSHTTKLSSNGSHTYKGIDFLKIYLNNIQNHRQKKK